MTEQEWLACLDPRAMFNRLISEDHLREARSGAMYGEKPTEPVLPKPSDRKLQLFATGCCRLIWDKLPTARHEEGSTIIGLQAAVRLSEKWIDNQCAAGDVRAANKHLNQQEWLPIFQSAYHGARSGASYALENTKAWGCPPERQALLLHHLVGNPYAVPIRYSRKEDVYCRPCKTCGWSGKDGKFECGTCFGYGGEQAKEYKPLRTLTVQNVATKLYTGDQAAALILHDALLDAAAPPEIIQHFATRETILEEGCELCNGTGVVEYLGNVCKPRVVIPFTHPKGCWVLDLILGKD